MELPLLLLVLLARAVAGSLRWRERGGAARIVLDMAPNSFDDRYLRCHFRMLRALPALNRSEFEPYGDYAEAWGRAAALRGSWAPADPPLPPAQAVALTAYTMEEGLYLEFNRAVRGAGRSRRQYLRAFPFKVLHFLLTAAVAELRAARARPRCLRVFRGADARFAAAPGRLVRFGQFASATLLKSVSDSYGTATTFEVDTCHGADIRNFSNYPEEEEVLIPPFETFEVVNVTHRGNGTDIRLRSHGVHSTYNCAWFRGRSVPREPPGLTGLLLAALAAVTGTP
ncbi:erythroblast NAD(P)(+)--arginine ADP-ribosyltransferase-like isoform X2 [Prinia subflava]|uniref:erythroblast NAD(P)(+)--arginine ADP-ribosyltransferase-like isoform X2 n=1 Tax=Prinia subflava TaxID=208062 RepID=UPI002FE162C1